MKLLFINCCIRDKESRTYYLANEFINKFKNMHKNVEIKEIKLYDMDLKPLLYNDIKLRDELISNNNFDNPIFELAKEFNSANRILIAAPYWDLSFPSLLKVYIEHICVNNINFKYENNRSVGLANYKSLMYISTAGGKMDNDSLDYIYKIHKFLSKKNAEMYYSIGNYFDISNENELKGTMKKIIKDFDNILEKY